VTAPALMLGAVLAVQTHAIPPPPDPIYDPVPGPYLVAVDHDGALSDIGVLDNAVDGWRGPKLSAFLLCFQPGRAPYDPRTASASFRALSRELKARGAVTVVVDPMYRCRTAPHHPLADAAHVEILGVLRDQD
jgi:hypothetical protein